MKASTSNSPQTLLDYEANVVTITGDRFTAAIKQLNSLRDRPPATTYNLIADDLAVRRPGIRVMEVALEQVRLTDPQLPLTTNESSAPA